MSEGWRNFVAGVMGLVLLPIWLPIFVISRFGRWLRRELC